eukprot:gene2606-5096_t
MNKYEVLGMVGEGAYGVVLKCRNKESGGIVAVKKFKESDDDEILRKTTLREVKILRLLRHSNIVSLLEAFRRKGKLYLVFEYVEKNLLEVLEDQPEGLETDLVRSYIFQLCQAIQWCHSHDVIHRDIKPENLLINVRTRSLKLCDFGFARLVTNKSTELTDYVATRWYRAPELLLGSTSYTSGVDVWAIGCIMGEITDGQPVFPGESEVDQLYIIQKVLGPLTPEHNELFLHNQRFAGLKFPDMSRPETLQKKYMGKLSKRALGFIKGMLNLNPAARPSMADSMVHPYFEDLAKTAVTTATSTSTSIAEPSPRQTGGGGGNCGVSNGNNNNGNGRSKNNMALVDREDKAVAASTADDRESHRTNGRRPTGDGIAMADESKDGAMRGSMGIGMGLVNKGISGREGVQPVDWRSPASFPSPIEDINDGAAAGHINGNRHGHGHVPNGNGHGMAGGNRPIPLFGLPNTGRQSSDEDDCMESDLKDSDLGSGMTTATKNRENRDRARELEKEAERERERQREKEIRAFREFSTKLPIQRRFGRSGSHMGKGDGTDGVMLITGPNPNLLQPLRADGMLIASIVDASLYQPMGMIPGGVGVLPFADNVPPGSGHSFRGNESSSISSSSNPPLNPRAQNKTPRVQQQVPPLDQQGIGVRSERSRGGMRPPGEVSDHYMGQSQSQSQGAPLLRLNSQPSHGQQGGGGGSPLGVVEALSPSHLPHIAGGLMGGSTGGAGGGGGGIGFLAAEGKFPVTAVAGGSSGGNFPPRAEGKYKEQQQQQQQQHVEKEQQQQRGSKEVLHSKESGGGGGGGRGKDKDKDKIRGSREVSSQQQGGGGGGGDKTGGDEALVPIQQGQQRGGGGALGGTKYQQRAHMSPLAKASSRS